MLSIVGCGRSSFEGLLQQHSSWRYLVVESPVLRDYYNTGNGSKFEGTIHVYFFLVIPIISSYLCSVNHLNHPAD